MKDYRVIRVLTIVERVDVSAISEEGAIEKAKDLAKAPAATRSERLVTGPWEVEER